MKTLKFVVSKEEVNLGGEAGEWLYDTLIVGKPKTLRFRIHEKLPSTIDLCQDNVDDANNK